MATEQIRAADLNTCFITLKYGDRLILVVLLARDGSINRMGDATSKADDTWYMGNVQEPLFDQLLEVVPDDLFQYAGRLEIPDGRGTDCELAVVFQHKDGRAVPFEILFGSENQDVPTELLDIVSRAMELTEPVVEGAARAGCRGKGRTSCGWLPDATPSLPTRPTSGQVGNWLSGSVRGRDEHLCDPSQ